MPLSNSAWAAQRPADRQALLALVRLEVLVPAAHRQTVGLADGRAGNDLDRQVQRLDHRHQDSKLLEILLSEAGHLGLIHIEQLGDHLADALKVPGAVLAFHTLDNCGRSTTTSASCGR